MSRIATITLIICAATAFPNPARSQSAGTVAKAKAFISQWKLSKSVLSLAHVTGTLKRVTLQRKGIVNDSRGRRKPGYFALTYRYTWTSSWDKTPKLYTTDLIYFFTSNGTFYQLTPGRTTGSVRPFVGAEIIVVIIKAVIREQLKTERNPKTRRRMQQLLNATSAKVIAELMIIIDQIRYELRNAG